MFGFMVKKWFFDMWDNFLGIVLFNLGFYVVLLVPGWLPVPIANASPLVARLVQGIGIVLVFIYGGVVSMAVREIAAYQRPEFGVLLGYLKETWKSSLVLGLIFDGIALVFLIGVPFYGSLGNLIGTAAIVFMLWAIIIFVLASQYYFPVRALLDSNIRKIIRKSFILLFDNTFFTIAMGIATILITGISFFTALLIPGLTGVLLWHQVGLKLRLYKYDYLEENPDASRKEIPWDALLIDEREKVGKRTLRGMIFPWKE